MDGLDQPNYTKPEAQRGLGLQFLIAFAFCCTSLITFSFCRKRLPQVYAARSLRKPGLPPLRSSFLGWIVDVIKVSDRDVLRFAGLDAYVYLMFFKAAITLLWNLSLVSLFFIAPLRWLYLGQFDDDDTMAISRWSSNLPGGNSASDGKVPNMFGDYVWVYVASTYIFTYLCIKVMRRYTNEVVSVRQAYLGHQNSVTDRTLRLSDIPRKLRSEQSLRKYLTTLFGAEPEHIVLCRNWKRLDELWEKRDHIVHRLEQLWSDYVGLDNPVFSQYLIRGNLRPGSRSTPSLDASEAEAEARAGAQPEFRYDNEEDDEDESIVDNVAQVWSNVETGGLRAAAARLFPNARRPMGRVKYYGLGGPKVDLLDHYDRQLAGIDYQIKEERENADRRSATTIAFVTMKTVAQAQLASQAIFSPKPHSMVSTLAPAPDDVIWKNVYLKPKQRSVLNYVISLLVLVTNLFLIYPLTYLSRLLDLDIIKKHFPVLGNWLAERKWMAALVTDVLPTYVFSFFNMIFPYFFAWLSKRQGFISRGDVEISTIGKNFFYVFVNLFLIFTIESTLFASFSVDEMARHFAGWLIRLSSFYTNLIVLQGLGLIPFRLMQPGSVFQIPFLASRCRTAREFHDLYKPERINYGLTLPNAMFFFIVTLTYSIMRRKILLFGLIYFAASYFVFKYQLMYTMVHPQHSNGQMWAVILRRVYLGIAVFHVAMIGILVISSAYRLAVLIAPLSLLVLGFWYDFERFTKPLLDHVAIEALRQDEIDQHNLGTYLFTNSDESSLVSDGDEDANAAGSTGAGTTTLGGDDSTAVSNTTATSTVNESTFSRTHRNSILNRAEAIASLDMSGFDGNADLSNRLWESSGPHDQTLDEEREQGLQYTNQNLVAPLDGPWVATSAFECVIATPEGFETRPITYREWL